MFFMVDDGLFENPKIIRLQQELSDQRFCRAITLWLACALWCRRNLTDGKIPLIKVKQIAPFRRVQKTCNDLQSGHLWHWLPDGKLYIFHDWTDYQGEIDKALKSREKQRLKKRNQRAKMSLSPQGTSRARDMDTRNIYISNKKINTGIVGSARSVPEANSPRSCEEMSHTPSLGQNRVSKLGALQHLAELALRSETASQSDLGPARAWPEVRRIIDLADQLFGTHTTLRTDSDPRVQCVLKRYSEGFEPTMLEKALHGAKSDPWVRSQVKLQTVTTLLGDPERVDKYARLLEARPAPGPRKALAPVQSADPNHYRDSGWVPTVVDGERRQG
jgi:hypothetical protein